MNIDKVASSAPVGSKPNRDGFDTSGSPSARRCELLLVGGISLALASCPAPAEAPTAAQRAASSEDAPTRAGEPLRFAFDWSPPCRVPAEELSKTGNEAGHKRYTIVLEREEDSTLRLRREDVVFLDASGKDILGAPGDKEKFEAQVGMASIVPTFWVSPEGKFLRSEALEQLLKRMRATGATAAEQQQVSSSKMAEVFDMPSAQHWMSWVGAWIDWPLRVHESRDVTVEQQGPLGSGAQALVTLEFLGMDGEFARLQRTTRMEGPEALQAMVHSVNALGRGAGAPSIPDDALRDAELTTRLYVETRPGTLQPRLSRFQHEVHGTFSDGQELRLDRFEEHHWHWERAQGCRRDPRAPTPE